MIPKINYYQISKYIFLLTLGLITLVNLTSKYSTGAIYSYGVVKDSSIFFVSQKLEHYASGIEIFYKPISENFQGPSKITSTTANGNVKIDDSRTLIKGEICGVSKYQSVIFGKILLFLKSINGLILMYITPLVLFYLEDYHDLSGHIKNLIASSRKKWI